ncbi:MAG: SWIM zinc finger family protein, partial [Gemmatimonas sp.]
MPHAGLVRYFAAPSRERGEALARARSVRLRGVTEVALVADAWGTDQYVIELDVAKKTVWMGCSCPHAHDGNFCKHLWAALLLLDTEPSPQAVALRSALAKVSFVRLTPVTAMSDEDAFND